MRTIGRHTIYNITYYVHRKTSTVACSTGARVRRRIQYAGRTIGRTRMRVSWTRRPRNSVTTGRNSGCNTRDRVNRVSTYTHTHTCLMLNYIKDILTFERSLGNVLIRFRSLQILSLAFSVSRSAYD